MEVIPALRTRQVFLEHHETTMNATTCYSSPGPARPAETGEPIRITGQVSVRLQDNNALTGESPGACGRTSHICAVACRIGLTTPNPSHAGIFETFVCLLIMEAVGRRGGTDRLVCR